MANRIGLWLIGARGGVATTVAIGLKALQRGNVSPIGLVSELPDFQHADIADWDELVIGGSEIRSGHLVEEAQQFQKSSRAFEASLLEQVEAGLREIDQRIRPGILEQPGEAIAQLADQLACPTECSPREKIECVKRDLQQFQQDHDLERVVVVNLASTEPPLAAENLPASWASLEPLLHQPGSLSISSSSLYAIAAIESGCSFVNFTPSLGLNTPALLEYARDCQIPHAGQDGKTGETLLKSALAPVFAQRNLQVMSWVGHNIFGNMDGQVLNDPVNKQTKVASKDKMLGQMLGYHPQSHISIEYIRSLGDWKTAWDHIHFQGFLGTPMVMQFTWQGCDSILAAPLVLDLCRFTERAHRSGEFGNLRQLAFFFKSPIGEDEHDLTRQFDALCQWAKSVSVCTQCQPTANETHG